MIKKKFLLFCTCSLSILFMACTQKASDPKQDNWEKYQQQNSITVGFDNTFVPMGYEKKMDNMQGSISTSQNLFLNN